jgi:hypothetical protein
VKSLLLRKDVPTRIRFNHEHLNHCNRNFAGVGAYDYAWKSFVVFISSIPSNERSADVSDATLLSAFDKKQDRKQNFALNNKLLHPKWAFYTRILTALVFVGFLQPSCV